MNISIISMQRIKNYGSFLQALGLKIMIESLGHRVEFLDYHVEPVLGQKSKKVKNTLGAMLINPYLLFKSFAYGIRQKDMYRKAYRFSALYSIKYLRLLNVGIKKKYKGKEDIRIIGSDEVFNCLQKNQEVGYSLDLFGKNTNASKLISYAASFGNTTIEKIRKYGIDKELEECFAQFNAISVRDKNSYNIIKELGGHNVHQHLDPVLVSDFSEYLIDKVDMRDYIIIYAYYERIKGDEAKIIREFAKKHNKKLICIGGVQSFCDDFIDCSPLEVLSYFKHADYVITDTFHGTIFSVVNRKQFVTIVRKSQGNDYGNEEKLTDLLSKLKLKDRQLVNLADMETLLLKSIDYTDTISVIDNERERTINYLKEQLS